jgi:anaerobic selenocysteine-containing dehydrogenase
LKGKIPSRRKFFKAAAATGAAATAAVAMPNIAFGAPQTLKCKLLGQVVLTSFLKWQETIVKWLMQCLAEHLKLTFSQLVQS